MEIHFLGAARTVTGSQYLIKINGQKLLLECGFFQGHRDDSNQRNLNFHFPAQSVDALILSHAHLDHCGNLPNLIKQGYTGKIYTTDASAHIADLVVRDSGHIQEADAAFINKRRALRGQEPIEPLYTAEDAARVADHFETVNYGQSFSPVKGVSAHLVDAGHILGSAAVVLDVREDGRTFRFWFSGDIGRRNLPLMKDPVMPDRPDFLMMECTYGDKIHNDPEVAYQEFRETVRRTVKRGGKIIVPAFALGRTQELVYFLNRMETDHDLPPIPVYVDSPLAVATTQVFIDHPQYFDEETLNFIRDHHHPALNFPTLKYVRSVDESKALNEIHEPMVIIAASGMAETGRILHHLRNNIGDPRNTIVIVSWQAPDTLGRRLAEQAREIKIFGEIFERKAEVVTIGGMSAHAGQDELLNYARAARGNLKEIMLIHGEPKGAFPLRDLIQQEHIAPISYPDYLNTVTL
jgi:metallo-beta-lactamase family protein